MLLQQRYPEFSVTEFFASRTVILVDEAQGSYKDSDFWNTIIKERRYGEGKDIKICLFCSYGSPMTGVDRVGFTPAIFGPEQRITLTPQPDEDSPKLGLFFTPDEFDEAVSLLTTNQYDGQFTFDEEAMSYLYKLTNGHPGGVTSIVNFLHSKHRSDIKHELISTITKDHVLDDLKDDTQVFRFLRNQAVFRSFPTGRHFTAEAAGTLSKILEEGNMRFDSDDVGMQTCYERGWLHRISVGEYDTDEVAILPSRLHEKWLEHIIGRNATPLPERFDQLGKLCLEVLSNFSTMNLRHAVQGHSIFWQAGVYRSTVNGQRTGDGRVDFCIPENKWAIQLLRDHDRVNEHISRFKEGGKYYSWLKEKMVED